MYKVPLFRSLLLAAFVLTTLQCLARQSEQKVISWVDTSLSGSEKYVLRVDGNPFYMTGVQYRADKLMGLKGWSEQQVRDVFSQLAADHFNTVSLPLYWGRVETEKDVFDWTRLDFYLDMVSSAGMKMELLWFGSNVCGIIAQDEGKRLRAPAYVMRETPGAAQPTASDYTICRASSDYTLDISDTALMHRETYVLSKVMEHIAQWDEAHGGKHTVIGVQINNEPRGMNGYSFSAIEMMRYQSAVASAVKQSRYVTWTRVNATTHEYVSYINANEKLRETEGTHIDFVGGDAYGKSASQLSTFIPTKGKNYKMIMECGAEEPGSNIFPFAAMSTNTAFLYYDYVGTDDHGFYDLTATKGVIEPHNENTIEIVRKQNRLLNSVMQDIATKAAGKGMKVHNATGKDPFITRGVLGTTFDPLSPTQAISICRSDSELVLVTILRGDWNIPASLHAVKAGKGYFNEQNEWVEEEELKFNGTYLPRVESSVIRLLLPKVANGLQDIPAVEFTPERPLIYDLQGNLLQSAPLSPGFYIKNGKKVYLDPQEACSE